MALDVIWVSLTNFAASLPEYVEIAPDASVMDLKILIGSRLESNPAEGLRLYWVGIKHDQAFPEQMGRLVLNEENELNDEERVLDMLQRRLPDPGASLYVHIVARDDDRCTGFVALLFLRH